MNPSHPFGPAIPVDRVHALGPSMIILDLTSWSIDEMNQVSWQIYRDHPQSSKDSKLDQTSFFVQLIKSATRLIFKRIPNFCQINNLIVPSLEGNWSIPSQTQTTQGAGS